MPTEATEKLNKKLVMTLLARDEEDIIEECITFHLKQGVDFIIATDNGSIDNTRNIFLKYQEKGVLELIDEPEHNYNQDAWVHRMILMAQKKHRADWVMNVDADEFWFSRFGNLKLALPNPKSCNVVGVGAIHSDPVDADGPLFKIPPAVSGWAFGVFKCLHTAQGYERIFFGNHGVKMKRGHRKAMTTLDIVVFHFPIRSYKHYERKVIISVVALKNNPRLNQDVGRQIRKSYELYEQGKLREEYDSLKTRHVNEPCYIANDSRLHGFISNGYRSIESVLSGVYGIYNARKQHSAFRQLGGFFSKKLQAVRAAMFQRS